MKHFAKISSEKVIFYGLCTVLGFVLWKTATKETFLTFAAKWGLASVAGFYAYKGIQKEY